MAKITTKEIYENLVNTFKTELKNGNNPFNAIGQPYNMLTERHYTGFNRWHMSMIIKQNSYTTSVFATYKQITEKGGQVRKGEKGYPVFFWGTLYVFSGNVTASGSSEIEALKRAQKKDPSLLLSDLKRKQLFMKHFTVFNLDQAENLIYEEKENLIDNPFYSLVAASSVANHVEATLPSYDITTDTLEYPNNQLDETLIMPVVQSTAHKTRLNRDLAYAEEQLVSTLGSSFISSAAGVNDVVFDEKLIDKWLLLLDEKPMFLYKASSLAQKASDFLLENISHLKSVESKLAS